MFKTLSDIGERLNSANIRWAVGGSLLLNQFGLIEKANDIDIFVDTKDIDKVDEILKNIGKKKEWENTDIYRTKYFHEYVIDDTDIDVMAGFAIKHKNGLFEYDFDSDSIFEFRTINNIDIPFASLEDWYVIYDLIPNREYKVDLIEKYLLSKGIKNPKLLKRSLEKSLPIETRKKIENILNL